MLYDEPVFRPPSEAYSLILQVTLGCSNNKCTFCGMYRSKKFRVRPFEEVERDIISASKDLQGIKRVFLADGDAMILKPKPLGRILDSLSEHIPSLTRVGIYADANGINNKTDEELIELKKKKLSIIYLGLESGSNTVLKDCNKGITAEEMTTAIQRANAAGIKTSVIGLLGLGGKKLSKEHAIETGKIVSKMEPNYFSALTVTVVPGTELHDQLQSGAFEQLSPEESLEELSIMLEHLTPERSVIFRTNHASNYLALQGTLPKDNEKIVSTIKNALKKGGLRPEWMRGL